MKKIILFVLLALSLKLFGQFPAPTNFNYQLNYIQLGDWGECNGKVIDGPNYCSEFHWSMPDTSLTSATLDSFNIYRISHNDTSIIAQVKDTVLIIEGGYMDSLYVVANYLNPKGKSSPSNKIFVQGLPIESKPIDLKINEVFIYDPKSKLISIETNDILCVKIINMAGQVVFSNRLFSNNIFIGELKNGIYILELVDNNKNISHNKFIKC